MWYSSGMADFSVDAMFDGIEEGSAADEEVWLRRLAKAEKPTGEIGLNRRLVNGPSLKVVARCEAVALPKPQLAETVDQIEAPDRM